jgi:hypothetical protein
MRRLAGEDGPGRTALPAGELLRPIPLAALVVLGVNDHLLKGSGWVPGWLTGKLSDVAGMIFFPLLLTSMAATILWLLRLRVDYSLRPWKLALAVAATGLVFAASKLVPGVARLMNSVLDPTDLLALPGLAVAWLVGMDEIRRGGPPRHKQRRTHPSAIFGRAHEADPARGTSDPADAGEDQRPSPRG